MRYIDADALTAEFKRLTLGENSLIERVFADGVYAVIETFPTADVVEVRHGYWLNAYEYALKIGATDERLIESAKNDKWWKFCCHCEQPVKWDYNYCPTCGAKMDGRRSNDGT